jgi:MerR family copper efflux transcriptional regulator
MVNMKPMLISDFCGSDRTDSRYGALLCAPRSPPAQDERQRWQPSLPIFTGEDVQTAEVIRVGQSLGISLKEIAALDTERRENGIADDSLIEILSVQLGRLEAKALELETMTRFVRAKIDWLSAGERGRSRILGNARVAVRNGYRQDEPPASTDFFEQLGKVDLVRFSRVALRLYGVRERFPNQASRKHPRPPALRSPPHGSVHCRNLTRRAA